MEDRIVTTKALAKVLGMSLASVNYYTALGLFKERDRKGNVRLYDKDEIVRVHGLIRQLRKEGYSLKLIQQKLDKGYNV